MDVYGDAKGVTPVLLCIMCYLQAVYPTERSGVGPESGLRFVSALQLVWVVTQQMCMLGCAHLVTYLFYWSP